MAQVGISGRDQEMTILGLVSFEVPQSSVPCYTPLLTLVLLRGHAT